MKRSLVTREALEALGYVAMVRNRSSAMQIDKTRKAGVRDTNKIFNAVVNAARSGQAVNIIEIPELGETRVYLESLVEEKLGNHKIMFLTKPTPGAENPAGYKMFYTGPGYPDGYRDALDFQKLTGWNMGWGTDEHGLNGDTWLVYQNAKTLPGILPKVAPKLSHEFRNK